jgi:hypothetical protein
MKKLLIFSMALLAITATNAQKSKSRNKEAGTTREEARRVILGEEKKAKAEKTSSGTDIFEGGSSTTTTGGGKASKNQPAKVRAAFQRDYPNASTVTWSKYRGDWTATFSNGGSTSTAVYHANGQRKDTRTAIGRSQLPQVIEDIFNKKQGVQVGHITRIDLPAAAQQIFRIKTIEGNSANYVFYDKHGKQVNYDY